MSALLPLPPLPLPLPPPPPRFRFSVPPPSDLQLLSSEPQRNRFLLRFQRAGVKFTVKANPNCCRNQFLSESIPLGIELPEKAAPAPFKRLIFLLLFGEGKDTDGHFLLSPSDHPPQPTLALKPSTGVAIEGQPLVFLCKAPAGEGERRFHFYREKAEVAGGTELISRETEAQLRVTESGRNQTGNFTCRYEEKMEGRWIPSYLSQAVEILVKGNGTGRRGG